MNIFQLVGTVAINKEGAVRDINVIKKSAEGASTAMGRSFTKFTGYVQRHSAQIKAAGRTMTILGGIATAAFGVSIKAAAKFEEELANVSTMLDQSAMKILPEYRAELQNLSMEFGESTATLSKGLYDILSASIPPAEALDVLAVSAKAATAGLTDTGTAADAITTIINSYGMEAKDAGIISDKLFAIVKRGKTTFGELAPAIGRVAATAAKSGLSFDELGATIATVTRAGINTRETMTSINGVLKSFLKPQTDAIVVAKQFGIELNTNTLRTIGLTGVMEKLKDATAEQLATIFGNVRGLKGMMAALGDAEGHARDYKLMLEAAGLTQEAFEKQSDTLSFKLKQLKQTFNVVKVEIGTALIPVVQELTENLMVTISKWKEWIEANPELARGIAETTFVLSALMIPLGMLVMMLPGLVVGFGGLGKALGGVVIAYKQIALTTAAINGLNFTSAGVVGKLALMYFGLQAAIVVAAVGVVKLIGVANEYYTKTLPALNRAQQTTVNVQYRLATALGVSLEQYQEWLSAGVGMTDMMNRAGVTLQQFKDNLAGFDVSVLSQELGITAERLWEIVESGEPIADLLERIGVEFSDLSGIASIAAGNLDKVSTAFRELEASQPKIEPIKDVFMLMSLDIKETEDKIKSLTQEMVEMKEKGFSTKEIDEYQKKIDALNERLGKLKNMINGLSSSGEELDEGMFRSAETYGKAIDLVEELTENMSDLEKQQASINEYWDEAIDALGKMGLAEEALNERTELYNKAREYELRLLDEKKQKLEDVIKAQEDYADSMKTIEDRMFELTHTQREIEIRDLDRKKEKLIEIAKQAELSAQEEIAAIKKIIEWYEKEISLLDEKKRREITSMGTAKLYDVFTESGEKVLVVTSDQIQKMENLGYTVKPSPMQEGGLIKTFMNATKFLASGGSTGTDTVPIMGTPGEYMVDKPNTDFIRATGLVSGGLVDAIVKGLPPPPPPAKFAGGGMVGTWGATASGGASVPVAGKSGRWEYNINFVNPVVRSEEDLVRLKELMEEVVAGNIDLLDLSGNEIGV